MLGFPLLIMLFGDQTTLLTHLETLRAAAAFTLIRLMQQPGAKWPLAIAEAARGLIELLEPSAK